MSEQMGCTVCDIPTYRPGPCDDCEQIIDRLLTEYNEAISDENDAVSRAVSAAQELEDMGVNVETDQRAASHG